MQIISRQEAKTQGLLRYFTGKPCIHGHIASRSTSCGQCFTCAVIKNKQYVKNNAELIKANARARYKKPTEKRKAQIKKWREENRDKIAIHTIKSNLHRKETGYRYYIIGPFNPKDELQWLKRAQALSRTLKRLSKLSDQDRSHLQKLGLEL